jgi:hypothetical protein
MYECISLTTRAVTTNTPCVCSTYLILLLRNTCLLVMVVVLKVGEFGSVNLRSVFFS